LNLRVLCVLGGERSVNEAMTEKQWQHLLSVLAGNEADPAAAFIVDSPWLPGWYGISTLEYYTSDDLWFNANARAASSFPGVIFLPGFWSEYGMCTEPSAFGARMVWSENEPPYAEKLVTCPEGEMELPTPDVTSDGLLPFVIQRLRNTEPRMKELGHAIRFAVARGPLNVASFLMGTTEFLTLVTLEPERAHGLLDRISSFLVSWLKHQKACFPTIDGILVLDDIVGFIGDRHCREFAVSYLSKVFSAFEASIRFFHNDAYGLVCAPYLEEIGVNLFNFGFQHGVAEMREKAGPNVTLLGNIPPRDVLAQGSVDDVRRAVRSAWISDHRLIWSCGGGMPPGVPTANIQAFVRTVAELAQETAA
jgi:uroporphyrinogen-III decarboxylase